MESTKVCDEDKVELLFEEFQKIVLQVWDDLQRTYVILRSCI